MSENKKEAKAWAFFHKDGLPTSSGSAYQGENERFYTELIECVGRGRMLDIGTGNMPIPILATQQRNATLEIYAIDVAEIQPQFHCQGVNFRQESSESTSFDDAFFDLVTGSYALEYSNIQASLVELYRIMKPGAIAGFIMHHPDSLVVRRMQKASDDDVPLPKKLQAFKVLEKFVDKPVTKNRQKLERLIKKLDEQEQITRYSMFRGVVDAMRIILQGQAEGKPVSRQAFDRWLRDALKKVTSTAYRHKLMQNSVVQDRQPIRDALTQLGAEIVRFDTIESDVDLGPGPGGAMQYGLIGWALVFKKTD